MANPFLSIMTGAGQGFLQGMNDNEARDRQRRLDEEARVQRDRENEEREVTRILAIAQSAPPEIGNKIINEHPLVQKYLSPVRDAQRKTYDDQIARITQETDPTQAAREAGLAARKTVKPAINPAASKTPDAELMKQAAYTPEEMKFRSNLAGAVNNSIMAGVQPMLSQDLGGGVTGNAAAAGLLAAGGPVIRNGFKPTREEMGKRIVDRTNAANMDAAQKAATEAKTKEMLADRERRIGGLTKPNDFVEIFKPRQETLKGGQYIKNDKGELVWLSDKDAIAMNDADNRQSGENNRRTVAAGIMLGEKRVEQSNLNNQRTVGARLTIANITDARQRELAEIAGKRVWEIEQFRAALKGAKPGDTMTVNKAVGMKRQLAATRASIAKARLAAENALLAGDTSQADAIAVFNDQLKRLEPLDGEIDNELKRIKSWHAPMAAPPGGLTAGNPQPQPKKTAPPKQTFKEELKGAVVSAVKESKK